jgi:hypothetical protein
MRLFWKQLDLHALLSTLACIGLLGVGAVRVLSYSRTNPISIGLRESALGWLTYQPDVPWSVRLFKLIATPVLVAMVYFVFRALNLGHRVRLPGHDVRDDRRIDFASPWLRLILTTVVTLHWIPLEYMKFTREDFYPNSPLESVTINVIVLLTGQALAFLGMRYLSFDPLVRDTGRQRAPLPDSG